MSNLSLHLPLKDIKWDVFRRFVHASGFHILLVSNQADAHIVDVSWLHSYFSLLQKNANFSVILSKVSFVLVVFACNFSDAISTCKAVVDIFLFTEKVEFNEFFIIVAQIFPRSLRQAETFVHLVLHFDTRIPGSSFLDTVPETKNLSFRGCQCLVVSGWSKSLDQWF